jgi:type III restriction enzyme
MGTRAFEEFVQQLEAEGLAVPVTKMPPALPVIVEPIRERMMFDIAIPLTASAPSPARRSRQS